MMKPEVTQVKVAPWLFAPAVLLGIALTFGAPAPSAATRNTIVVGPAANGSQRRLERGDRLVVRLASNASTGYAWQIRSGVGGVLVLVARTYVPASDGSRLGAPGTAVLRLRAAACGRTVLRLAYVRSWEKDVAPARTFGLRVTVVSP